MQKHPMTREGAKLLEQELQRLKTVERPRIVAAIAEARAHGDLKENAEYHAAKESQSFVEGRIQELEHKLSYAQIIDVRQITKSDKVVFGVTVHLINLDTDEEIIYRIVGEDEADIKAGKISYTSPIARGVIGKSLYDTVEINTPAGRVSYEINEIEYI
jgi:transcription elongation factor GreA